MKIGLILSSVALMVAGSAFAADLPAKKAAPAAPVAPAAPSLADTIGIEVSPEFYAANSAPKADGGLVDAYAKLSYAHTFDGVWVLGGSYQFTQRAAVDINSSVSQFEVNTGYKYKINALTITPGLGLGYAIGTPKIITTDNNASASYYSATLNFDYKVDANWTVNALGLRYRQSFDGYWYTPKVSTGVTYAITPADAIYVNLGYAWKYTAQQNGTIINGDDADKSNVAVGYKHSF